MTAYYNENDPGLAAWLRELIRAGAIAPGYVDERSIEDVEPKDLEEFTQCHFFAGIGVWSYALRCAGWDDARPVWTGSCPCQPFSSAGKRKGFADKRHLWPAWCRLIRECRPVAVYSEQVASHNGLAWLDAVSADLEAEGYAVGAVVFPACGVGAPDLRQRLYFVADTIESGRRQNISSVHEGQPDGSRSGEGDKLADSDRERQGRQSIRLLKRTPRQEGVEATGSGEGDGVGDSVSDGVWSGVEWLPCERGKLRPVQRLSESEFEQMADGTAADMGYVRIPGGGAIIAPVIEKANARKMRLSGYGNALCAPQAIEFVKATK